MAKRLIDIKDLALELKIAPKTIRNRLSNKSWPIPPIRIGRTLRWRRSDVTRALTKLTDQAESKSAEPKEVEQAMLHQNPRA